MLKSIPLAAMCCLVLAGVGRAEAPAPPAPAPDAAAEKWIEQLGDSDYRKRDEASRALQAEGLKALPALRKAINHPEAEIRRRAADLLPALETAVLLAPKRFTGKFAGKPIKDVFDELTRQTDYKIEYNVNDPTKTYNFDFDDVPFWEAVDRLSRASGLVLQQGYGDDHVRLYQQEATSPFVHYNGPFRFTATGFQQYRNIDFNVGKDVDLASHRNESLTLTFFVASEPRIPLLGIGEVHLEAAYDSDKNSLLPPANPNDFVNNLWGMHRFQGGRYGNGNRMYTMQTQVNLQRHSDKATTVKLVRGTVPLTLLVDQKPAVVAEKIMDAKGSKTQIGTTQFVVEDVSEVPGKQYKIKLSITEDLKDNPNDYSWMNSLYGRIELLDEKGGKMQIYSSNWGNSAPGHAQMELTFGTTGGAKAEPPGKLIYQQWTTLQYTAPFEFKDLPLP